MWHKATKYVTTINRRALKKILLLAMLGMVLGAFFSCAMFRAYTPKIKKENAETLLTKLKIGGVKQHVLIRTEDVNNPLLLFLHGGPGMPLMYLSHAFQKPLEKDFTVVQWDMRGAGKSYNKRLDTLTINDEQFYADSIELIAYLTKSYNKKKVLIVGHSWGSLLGSIVADRSPELLHAFISVGQVVNDQKALELQKNFIAEKARSENRMEAIYDLEKFGSGAHEKWLFKFRAEIYKDTSYQVFVKEGLRSPEYNLFDALKISKGSQFSSRHMKYKLITSSIEEEIQSFEVPVFFLVGNYDMTTPYPLIESYYESIRAPMKKIFWFEESAHFPFYEEKEKFARTMKSIKDLILMDDRIPQ